jgi:hypothetical protein
MFVEINGRPLYMVTPSVHRTLGTKEGINGEGIDICRKCLLDVLVLAKARIEVGVTYPDEEEKATGRVPEWKIKERSLRRRHKGKGGDL